jgi:type I restriction enzyme S subunit
MPEQTLAIPNEAGWPSETLSDVCELIRRGTAPSYVAESDVYAIGQRCVTASGFDPSFARPHEERRMSGTLEPKPGDVLLNSTGTGTIGRSCTFSGSGRFIVDGHVTVLRPKESGADGRWIEALVRSSWGQTHLESRCFSGSTNQVELSRSQLASTAVPAPPIWEQRRIAKILDAVDDAIRSTESLIAKLSQVKNGLLHDLMTRGIDEKGGVRSRADRQPDLYRETRGGQLPKEWDVGLLDSLAVRGSGHTPNKNVPSYWDGGIRWVSLADSARLDNVWIQETDKEISDLGIANSSAVKHVGGTVILSRDAGVGKSAILVGTMAVSQHFMAWTCGPRLNNVYLYYWLQHAKPRFEAIAMGSTIKTIGLPYFKKLEIAVPGRREQDAVAGVMLDSDRVIWKTGAELDKLRALKAGLMDDLLTGHVRVNFDEDAA